MVSYYRIIELNSLLQANHNSCPYSGFFFVIKFLTYIDDETVVNIIYTCITLISL